MVFVVVVLVTTTAFRFDGQTKALMVRVVAVVFSGLFGAKLMFISL